MSDTTSREDLELNARTADYEAVHTEYKKSKETLRQLREDAEQADNNHNKIKARLAECQKNFRQTLIAQNRAKATLAANKSGIHEACYNAKTLLSCNDDAEMPVVSPAAATTYDNHKATVKKYKNGIKTAIADRHAAKKKLEKLECDIDTLTKEYTRTRTEAEKCKALSAEAEVTCATLREKDDHAYRLKMFAVYNKRGYVW